MTSLQTATASEAHKLATFASPDGDIRPAFASPVKVLAKQAFVPLSPGPEKAKLHMDAVASLLGLSTVEPPTVHTTHTKARSPSVPDLDEWTIIRQSSSSETYPPRAAKRLSASEIYGRTLTLTRSVFETLFGKQASSSTNALVEPTSGSLLALAAEAASVTAPHVSLRAGPLIKALRAVAGDVLVLTATRGDASKPGAPPRVAADLNPSFVMGCSNGTDAAITSLKTIDMGDGHPGSCGPHDGRSGSRSPASLDSLTQVTDGEGFTDGVLDTKAPKKLTQQHRGGRSAKINAYKKNGDGGATSGRIDRDVVDDGSIDPVDDPEYPAPRIRRRPKKRGNISSTSRSAGAAAAPTGPLLTCAHCGTQDTPRWWKDAFPMGTLCNACGIWLKRHGYPRPVQFFADPATVGGVAVVGVPTGAQAAAAAVGDFYLINGRPKRRRPGTSGIPSPVAVPSNALGAGSVAEAEAGGAGVGSDEDGLMRTSSGDSAINFAAAGGRVFILRRTLLMQPHDCGGASSAALVHFGWAPGARAAHEMFDKVSAYGAHGGAEDGIAVQDFELLADTKASVTLTAKKKSSTEATPTDWDAVVKRLVDEL